jgi:hypothetical protein
MGRPVIRRCLDGPPVDSFCPVVIAALAFQSRQQTQSVWVVRMKLKMFMVQAPGKTQVAPTMAVHRFDHHLRRSAGLSRQGILRP